MLLFSYCIAENSDNIVLVEYVLKVSLWQWRREVAFAGFEVAIQMDISAEKMICGVSGIDPQRRAELIKVRSEY